MTTETIVKQFLAAMVEKDADQIEALLADDVVFEDVPENSPITGKEAVFEKFKGFFGFVTKLSPKILNEAYTADTAMIERENHLDINGQKVVLPVVTIFKVRDNKVTLFRDYFDGQTFMNQLA